MAALAPQAKVQVDLDQLMEHLQVVPVEAFPVATQWAALEITEYQITFSDRSILTPAVAEAVVITISHQMLLDRLAAMAVEQDAVTQQQLGRQTVSTERPALAVAVVVAEQDLLDALWAVKVDLV